jgi:hypothetical protein
MLLLTSFFRALYAEQLKLKRTLALRMVFVAPLLIGALNFFALYQRRNISPDFKMWDTISKTALREKLETPLCLAPSAPRGLPRQTRRSARADCFEYLRCHAPEYRHWLGPDVVASGLCQCGCAALRLAVQIRRNGVAGFLANHCHSYLGKHSVVRHSAGVGDRYWWRILRPVRCQREVRQILPLAAANQCVVRGTYYDGVVVGRSGRPACRRAGMFGVCPAGCGLAAVFETE